nr:sigma-70 family RNA polymerase sigma factor [Thermoleophilaceae bacterium]
MLRDTDGVQGRRLAAAGRFRPGRSEIDPAALDLLGRFGAQILGQARRFSLSPEDAEDAYQRGVEILLTKAPTTETDELLPWLKTVVKHEALAIRKQRDRLASPGEDGVAEPPPGAGTDTHDQAERLEKLRMGAEALANLKPQEVRALLLRAEGFSYRQIAEETGWSATKVNRCVAEGRKAFLARVKDIQAGEECERLAPLMSAFADGEAGTAEVARLRPHLKTCMSCRAQLREYRAVPARVAVLVPVAAAAAPGGSNGRFVEGLVASVQDRLAFWTERTQGVWEVASAQKLAAVAASTAALAGGGTVAVTEVREYERERTVTQKVQRSQLASEDSTGQPRPAPTPPVETHDPPAPPEPVASAPAAPQESKASEPAKAEE